MNYTTFEKQLLVGAYELGEELVEQFVPVRQILDTYMLSPRPNWISRALEAYLSYGYATDVRHIGQEIDQEVFLTGAGVREAERLIEEGFMPPRTPALETSPEEVASPVKSSEPELLLQRLIPAADRLVSSSHNAPKYIEAISKVEEARKLISESNQLAEDEKQDTLVHLDAGLSVLKRAKRFTVGVVRYLVLDRLKAAFEGVIEDAFKITIIGAFMLLAALLIAAL